MIMKTIFQRKTNISSDTLPKICCRNEDHPEASVDTMHQPICIKEKEDQK
jgi:hypothetical protein